jgi:hypothetical protein
MTKTALTISTSNPECLPGGKNSLCSENKKRQRRVFWCHHFIREMSSRGKVLLFALKAIKTKDGEFQCQHFIRECLAGGKNSLCSKKKNKNKNKRTKTALTISTSNPECLAGGKNSLCSGNNKGQRRGISRSTFHPGMSSRGKVLSLLWKH